MNILNVNKTDKQTFYKDIKTGKNFANDMIGVYTDGDYVLVEGYTLVGILYIYLADGDFKEGVVKMTEFLYNEWSGVVYMKYQLNENFGGNIYDDTLYIEYFNSLSAAKGAFTENKFTYIRLWEH